jgi:hypothetical protein
MDVLKVEVALLRANLPELTLRPGMTLPGRVLERAGQFGVLMLAGTALTAELPDNLAAGATVRLRVEEIGADRVVLRALEAPPAAPTPQPPPDIALPVPGGGRAEVRVTDGPGRDGQGAAPTTIALAYQSPALGTLELRLVHRPGAGLQVTVGAIEGIAEERARVAAEELREALSRAVGAPATVTVVGRPPEPKVDIYA